MRKLVLPCVCLVLLCTLLLVAMCHPLRKGVLEYDDRRNGLHVRAPGPDWTILIDSDCPSEWPSCWEAWNVKNHAKIVLANATTFGRSADIKSPAEDMQEIVHSLHMREQVELGNFSVSALDVSVSGDIARVSWENSDSDGQYVMHIAVIRMPNAPARLLMFWAYTRQTDAREVEEAFTSFLDCPRPFPAPAP